MKQEVCVTTFVFGEKYQGYIPLLIYSLLKSYPEYMPIIFVHNTLREDIKVQLNELHELGEFIIKENAFNEFKKLNVFQGKSIRWLIRDKDIMKYEYSYFVDIDIFYIREIPSLVQQHIKHMDKLDLPFSNVVRDKINKNRSLKLFVNRVKTYGFKNALNNFIKGNVKELRLSGLHFVRNSDYFTKIKKYQEEQLDLLKTDQYLKHYQGYSNETLLYRICQNAGFDMNKLGNYSDKISLDYNNYDKLEFRPHHGIHLGIFRNAENLSQVISGVADTPTYKYYIKEFQSNYVNDTLFLNLLNQSDDYIKEHFRIMFEYYGLHKNKSLA